MHSFVLQIVINFMINFPLMLLLLSLVIWSIAAFRQYGNQYFYFFIILAVCDPIGLMYILAFHSQNIFIYATLNFAMYFSLPSMKTNRYKLNHIILFLVVILAQHFLINSLIIDQILYGIAVLLILLKILEIIIIKINSERIINILLLLLFLYQLSVFTKFIIVFTNQPNALTFYHLTTIFEILLGLYFCFFKEDKFRILLKFQ